jgi:hypothetical protein
MKAKVLSVDDICVHKVIPARTSSEACDVVPDIPLRPCGEAGTSTDIKVNQFDRIHTGDDY